MQFDQYYLRLDVYADAYMRFLCVWPSLLAMGRGESCGDLFGNMFLKGLLVQLPSICFIKRRSKTEVVPHDELAA